MKHFLLTCFIPMTLAAQNMQQLTEQLGKTVLYGDVALSPDGTHVAWVQSIAATTSKQTYIRETSGNAPAKLVKLPITGERTDFDLVVPRFEGPGVFLQRRRKRPAATLDREE